MIRILRPFASLAALAAPALAAGLPAAAATAPDPGYPSRSAEPARTAPERSRHRQQQISQRRAAPRRRTPRRTFRRRYVPVPDTPRRFAPYCIPGFRVYRTPDQTSGPGSYVCTSYIRFVCATPYSYQTHGLQFMGGDGDYWPYYRCRRTYRTNHVGATLCATGFQKLGPPPNPQTTASYLCRGQEPDCSPGYHYVAFKKRRGGWWYRCVK